MVKRFRLLPDDHGGFGVWLTSAWLVYLLPLLIDPYVTHASPLVWAVTVGAMIAFVVLYFRAYWTKGIELLVLIGLMTLLGVAFAPFNVGASAFFIFAGSFL